MKLVSFLCLLYLVNNKKLTHANKSKIFTKIRRLYVRCCNKLSVLYNALYSSLIYIYEEKEKLIFCH